MVAPASARLVQVSEGELETMQFDGGLLVFIVVVNTSNAPVGTPVKECIVADVPDVLVSKLCMDTGGCDVAFPVVNDQL